MLQDNIPSAFLDNISVLGLRCSLSFPGLFCYGFTVGTDPKKKNMDDGHVHGGSAEFEMQLLLYSTPNNKDLFDIPGGKHGARDRQRLLVLCSFRWEIFCFSLATVSLVALFAILWNCHGNKNPHLVGRLCGDHT